MMKPQTFGCYTEGEQRDLIWEVIDNTGEEPEPKQIQVVNNQIQIDASFL